MNAGDLAALIDKGAPLEVQREAFEATLKSAGIADGTIAQLMAQMRDGIVMRATEEERHSHLGGPGLLPLTEDWPRDRDGVPLTFIAAFDLGELPRLQPLPEEGTLLVYWKLWEDFSSPVDLEMDWFRDIRVFWVAPDEPLREERTPEGYEPELEAVSVEGRTMPVAGNWYPILHQISDDEESKHFQDVMEEIFEKTLWRGGGGVHQLLGASRDLQGPALDSVAYWLSDANAETKELFSPEELDGKGWTFLAQIEEDRHVRSLSFAAGGNLLLLIPEVDLLAKRFDRVLSILDTT